MSNSEVFVFINFLNKNQKLLLSKSFFSNKFGLSIKYVNFSKILIISSNFKASINIICEISLIKSEFYKRDSASS